MEGTWEPKWNVGDTAILSYHKLHGNVPDNARRRKQPRHKRKPTGSKVVDDSPSDAVIRIESSGTARAVESRATDSSPTGVIEILSIPRPSPRGRPRPLRRITPAHIRKNNASNKRTRTTQKAAESAAVSSRTARKIPEEVESSAVVTPTEENSSHIVQHVNVEVVPLSVCEHTGASEPSHSVDAAESIVTNSSRSREHVSP